ncbi:MULTISPECIES: DNA-processing protein DprA [unclassified Nocardioides]|uniref:DNA-processing protein DprA n=1 Tax=Nocardioides sp. XL1 TaxID=2003120 RepID=UPI001EE46072|nr:MULTISPECIES: DNA-processing protein DprA [unclassified Nocardioides]
MAGLAEGTVLVEGAVRSGAMNTAHWTTNLHRPVLALPGPVTSVASAGVHQLIRLGEASMVTNAPEILNDLIGRPAATAARSAQVDESYAPSPARHTPAPLGAAAPSTRWAPGR